MKPFATATYADRKAAADKGASENSKMPHVNDNVSTLVPTQERTAASLGGSDLADLLETFSEDDDIGGDDESPIDVRHPKRPSFGLHGESRRYGGRSVGESGRRPPPAYQSRRERYGMSNFGALKLDRTDAQHKIDGDAGLVDDRQRWLSDRVGYPGKHGGPNGGKFRKSTTATSPSIDNKR